MFVLFFKVFKVKLQTREVHAKLKTLTIMMRSSAALLVWN